MIVRIPVGLASLIASQRKLVQKYHTNRAYKAYAAWLACKPISSSGVFILNHSNKETLCNLLGCTSSTLYRHLEFAQKEGLIEIKKGSHLPNKKSNQPFSKIRHISWDTVFEKHSIIKAFYCLDFNKEKHSSIHRVLQVLEYCENEQKQIQAYNSKIHKYPNINNVAQKIMEKNGNTISGQKEIHSAAREYLFSQGGTEAEYETLFQANPDFNRCAKTIQDQKNMKSHTTAVYEQKILSKLNLIIVTRRAPVICAYNLQKDKTLIKGRAVNCVRIYAKDDKVAYWNKPNDIQIKIEGLELEEGGRKR